MPVSKLRYLFFLLIALGTVHCAGSKSDDKKSTPATDENKKDDDQQSESEDRNTFDPDKETMLVLGDSISAAMLAASNFGEAFNESVLRNLFLLFPDDPANLKKLFEGTKKVSIEDLGKRVSWSTTLGAFNGIQDYSHKMRLKKDGRNLKSYNMAVIGSRIADAGKQLDEVKEMYGKGLNEAFYVTFGFGGNDYCQNTPLSQFSLDFGSQLEQVVKEHRRAVILVNAIPNVPQLFDVAAQSAVAVKLEGDLVEEHLGSSLEYTCEQTRAALHACPYILSASASDARKRLDDMNAAIADAVKALQGKNKNKLVFAEELGTFKFQKKHIAGDCFHPSAEGQEVLADITWDAVKDSL